MRIHESLKVGGVHVETRAAVHVCIDAIDRFHRWHRSFSSTTPIDQSRSPLPALVVEGVPFGSSRSSRARGVAGDVVDVDGGRRRGNAREGCVDDVVVVVVGNVVVGDVVVERVVGDGGERVVGDERERVVDESAEEDGERARAR